jgi:predicted pyridoxine 5'-phosphate oxidase superfamily flavin-nucleotide-binding protein
MTDQERLIEALIQRVEILQRQQDESAWNDIALIATLKELLPGFSPRFDQLRIGVEKLTSPTTPQELAKLLEAFRNSRQ